MKHTKSIMLVTLALLISLTLTACAKKGNCEECGQYEKLNKFTEKNGTVHWYCDYDYNMAKLFYD